MGKKRSYLPRGHTVVEEEDGEEKGFYFSGFGLRKEDKKRKVKKKLEANFGFFRFITHGELHLHLLKVDCGLGNWLKRNQCVLC